MTITRFYISNLMACIHMCAWNGSAFAPDSGKNFIYLPFARYITLKSKMKYKWQLGDQRTFRKRNTQTHVCSMYAENSHVGE